MARNPIDMVFFAALTIAAPAIAETREAPRLVASWAASPASNNNPFIPYDIAVSGQTIRQHVRLSRGGSGVRVTFSNEFGSTTLRIGAASVAVTDARGTAKRVALTFGGAGSAEISPGAPLVSDIVGLPVEDGARLEVRMYLPGEVKVTTIHEFSLDVVDASSPGDFTRGDALPGATAIGLSPDPRLKKQSSARPFLTEVDVVAAPTVHTVVAFGDSITDGAGSTPGADRRWPDVVAQRARARGLPLAIINEGISGNRILADGLGVSAVARFDRDVLSKPGVGTVMILEGINDIGFSGGMVPRLSPPEVIRAEAIIAGYLQLVSRAHARGLRVIVATMTPWRGSPAFTPEKERVREQVNAWLRDKAPADGLVDFDRTVRDPMDPTKLAPAFDSGDHIHPSDAGYAAMGTAVDLAKL